MTDVKSEPQEPSATPSTLEQVIAEMRTIALVAGQASVEGPQDGKSLMAAAESARASRWANALAALRPSEGPRLNIHQVDLPADAARGLRDNLWALYASEGPETGRPPELVDLPSPVHSFDAMVWAESFVAHVTQRPTIATDEGTMLGWFASALMRGFDEAHRRRDVEVREFIGFLSAEIPELHHVEVPRLADAYKTFLMLQDPDCPEARAYYARTSAALPAGLETGDRERLRALATPQVQDNHDYALFGSENVGPVPGGDGHSGEYDTCPHPDCVLVRQAAPAASERK